ncbi:hypothetical protein HYV91_02490 [Candidatus Wolfebacteria bacterium]|nr:hypothetical protein [Candidatus Wolfebacteria bacterium]
MNKNLLTYLKELRKIEPDSAYSARSRFLILASGPKAEKARFFDVLKTFRLQTSLEIGGAVVISTLLIFYFTHQARKDALVVQADEINASIQLKLNEIKYILQNKPSSENVSPGPKIDILLQEAVNDFKIAEENLKNNNIEESLEKIKETREILTKIERAIRN